MYKVIKFFHDLQDNNHPYNVGDEYPRKDVKVTDERIAELSGKDNKQGVPLIAEENTTDIAKMKIEDLKKYAAEKSIDLGEATRKDEILAKIKEAETADK